jgi:hypothetical protein
MKLTEDLLITTCLSLKQKVHLKTLIREMISEQHQIEANFIKAKQDLYVRNLKKYESAKDSGLKEEELSSIATILGDELKAFDGKIWRDWVGLFYRQMRTLYSNNIPLFTKEQIPTTLDAVDEETLKTLMKLSDIIMKLCHYRRDNQLLRPSFLLLPIMPESFLLHLQIPFLSFHQAKI